MIREYELMKWTGLVTQHSAVIRILYSNCGYRWVGTLVPPLPDPEMRTVVADISRKLSNWLSFISRICHPWSTPLVTVESLRWGPRFFASDTGVASYPCQSHNGSGLLLVGCIFVLFIAVRSCGLFVPKKQNAGTASYRRLTIRVVMNLNMQRWLLIGSPLWLY